MPLAQVGSLRGGMLRNPVLKQIAAAYGTDVFAIMLAFVLRNGNVFAVPKASTPPHTKANREAVEIILSNEEVAQLDKAFPMPSRDYGLDMV